MKRDRKRTDDRNLLMERAAGLRAMSETGRISKVQEFAGFLAIMHPEMSEKRRIELAREMARGDA